MTLIGCYYALHTYLFFVCHCIAGCLNLGQRAGSDTHSTDGIVDGHAYSVLECVNDVEVLI